MTCEGKLAGASGGLKKLKPEHGGSFLLTNEADTKICGW